MPNMLLTDAAIRKLRAPAAGQVEIYDKDVAGLALRIGSSGTRVFYYNYRVCKQKGRIKLGVYDATSLAAARKKATVYRKLVDDGVDPREYERLEAQRRLQERSKAF